MIWAIFFASVATAFVWLTLHLRAPAPMRENVIEFSQQITVREK